MGPIVVQAYCPCQGLWGRSRGPSRLATQASVRG
jgi:hypothetical protein